MLKDRGCANVLKGLVSSELNIVVRRKAAAYASEGARKQVVWTRLEARGGGSGYELARGVSGRSEAAGAGDVPE